MIIDAHTHIGIFEESGNKTAEDLIASMDEAGIDVSFVIANNFAQETNGATNQAVIDAAKKFPRLKAIGNIDYEKVGDSRHIQEIQSLIKEKLIMGVKFYTGYQYFYPNDPRLYPIYEFCTQHAVPVIYHMGALLTGSKGLLKYSHPLNIDELATQFPKLKIVIAHLGNPWIKDCAAVVSKNPNVYTDLSGYFTEFQTISQEEQKDFLRQLSTFKTFTGNFNKCIFGTDWWLYSQKEYLEVVQNLPMSKEEKELVLWKNATDIFNL